MSDKYPKGYKIPEKPVVGVLSGWNKITTNRGDGTTPEGDHGFTVPDLLRLLKVIREEFNPKRIGEIEELIRRHIARLDNPHQTDLKKMGTSVLQELYLLWLEYGNQGKSREEFLKVLFQYVKIADIETTRAGDAFDEVVHAFGLKTVMNDHDTNPEAHLALFETLFPGQPVYANPTYGIDAFVGLPADAEVTRNTSMTIYTATGVLKEIPGNTLMADYSSGKCAFPIFGETINYVEESENFGNTDFWRCKYSNVVRSAGIQSPRSYSENAYVLKEVANANPVCHEMRYIRENWTVIAGQYYTISLFVSPMGRNAIGIELGDVIDPEDTFGFKDSGLLPFDRGMFLHSSLNGKNYRNIHFDITTQEVFISDKAVGLTGYVYPLYNGWYRIQATFQALRTMPFQFRIYPLDIFDGDESSEGVNNAGVAIFGIMGTEGPTLPPYIPSLNGKSGKIGATSVQIPLDDWYKKDTGTIVAQFNNNAIDCRLKSTSEIYNIGNAGNSIVALARMPVGHNNRVYMAGYGTNSTLLASQYTEGSKEPWLTIMQGYGYPKHLFAGEENDAYEIDTNKDVNQNANYLYLGCDRYKGSQLNGFLTHLYYYPELLRPGNINFFTGKR